MLHTRCKCGSISPMEWMYGATPIIDSAATRRWGSDVSSHVVLVTCEQKRQTTKCLFESDLKKLEAKPIRFGPNWINSFLNIRVDSNLIEAAVVSTTTTPVAATSSQSANNTCTVQHECPVFRVDGDAISELLGSSHEKPYQLGIWNSAANLLRTRQARDRAPTMVPCHENMGYSTQLQ